jgi:hypothetical protein
VIRAILCSLSAAVLWLAVAAPAQAVTWNYCYNSVRGYTGLAGDNDVRYWWDVIERNHGQLSHTEHAWWTGADGAYTVSEGVRYYYRAGGSITLGFTCQGSGGLYQDWRSA